jgi:hypothetical protein
MPDFFKRALTRKIHHRGPDRRDQVIVLQPNIKLVLLVKFAVCMVFSFSLLEIAHLAFMGSWNSEIFAAITGLSGTVMGIFVGQKAG